LKFPKHTQPYQWCNC